MSLTKTITQIVAEIDAQMQLDPAYLSFHGHKQETVRLRTDDWLVIKAALSPAPEPTVLSKRYHQNCPMCSCPDRSPVRTNGD